MAHWEFSSCTPPKLFLWKILYRRFLYYFEGEYSNFLRMFLLKFAFPISNPHGRMFSYFYIATKIVILETHLYQISGGEVFKWMVHGFVSLLLEASKAPSFWNLDSNVFILSDLLLEMLFRFWMFVT